VLDVGVVIVDPEGPGIRLGMMLASDVRGNRLLPGPAADEEDKPMAAPSPPLIRRGMPVGPSRLRGLYRLDSRSRSIDVGVRCKPRLPATST
jgi:hypothetical protein